MRVVIETIPHNAQRYDTVGDWFWDGDTLQIRVSEMSNWKREFLVAYHELFESAWCKAEGVSQKDVDKFDTEYEKNRKDDDESEPGDSLKAPYRVGHQIASAIEKLACVELGEDWASYDEEVANLSQNE